MAALVALLLFVDEAQLFPDGDLVLARLGLVESLLENRFGGPQLVFLGEGLSLVEQGQPVVGVLASRLLQGGKCSVVLLGSQLGTGQQHQIVIAGITATSFCAVEEACW